MFAVSACCSSASQSKGWRQTYTPRRQPGALEAATTYVAVSSTNSSPPASLQSGVAAISARVHVVPSALVVLLMTRALPLARGRGS